jgi:hypothetical protein
MFAHRTATGLTVALLALPATATAAPLTDQSVGANATPDPSTSQPFSFHRGARTDVRTSSLAGTTSQSFVSPDAADAARAATASQSLVSPDAADSARAGDIARAMGHYERSQPAPATAEPASHPGDNPAWPEIAFAGVILLATAGGVARVRLRHSRRVAA